jgi:hypothetical protein
LTYRKDLIDYFNQISLTWRKGEGHAET